MTERHGRRLLALALAALGCAHGAMAETTTAAPVVAEKADALLKQMGDYLAAADEFTFTADVTFDHVLPTGQKLAFAGREDVGVARPNRAYVDWQSDLGARRFWYDGTTLTVTDPATPFYAARRHRRRWTRRWSWSRRSWASRRRSAIFSTPTPTASCGRP